MELQNVSTESDPAVEDLRASFAGLSLLLKNNCRSNQDGSERFQLITLTIKASGKDHAAIFINLGTRLMNAKSRQAIVKFMNFVGYEGTLKEIFERE